MRDFCGVAGAKTKVPVLPAITLGAAKPRRYTRSSSEAWAAAVR
jgi:hypothetical protein